LDRWTTGSRSCPVCHIHIQQDEIKKPALDVFEDCEPSNRSPDDDLEAYLKAEILELDEKILAASEELKAKAKVVDEFRDEYHRARKLVDRLTGQIVSVDTLNALSQSIAQLVQEESQPRGPQPSTSRDIQIDGPIINSNPIVLSSSDEDEVAYRMDFLESLD